MSGSEIVDIILAAGCAGFMIAAGVALVIAVRQGMWREW
jgi:hypothetical protein